MVTNCAKYFGMEHIFRAAGLWFLVGGRETFYLNNFPAVPRQLSFYVCQLFHCARKHRLV